MTPQAAAARQCPVCARPAMLDRRPFCSQRCADVDLGRWLTGAYAIPGAAPEDEATPRDTAGNDDVARQDAAGDKGT